MIGCTEFIPAYSELFRFLEQEGCRQAVVGFWEYLSDGFLGNLRSLVEKNGIRGCWEYWAHTLNEEAADFTMELDEDAGEFRIIMRSCPSKRRLLQQEHIEPYRHYCEHCDVLYRRVFEPLGYEYDIDLSRCDEAMCSLVVRRKADSRP